MSDELVRFGRLVQDMPAELKFGSWGVLGTPAALELFADSLAYFDQEDVRQAEADRLAMIQAARRYHEGNQVKPLKVEPGEHDDNVLMNLCRSLVDDSVSWLFGNPETGILQITSDDGEEVNPVIAETYERSGGFLFYKRLGVRGGIAGHSFVKLIQEPNGEPRVVALDPQLVSVRVEETDTSQVLAYKIEWRRTEADPGTRRKDVFIYRQMVVNAGSSQDPAWIVADFKAKDRAKRDWNLINGPWAWPWKWSPIHDCPNIEAGWGHYGLSDLEDVTGLNDALNFVVSNTIRIIKIHAHPKTVGTGFTAGDLQDTAIDSFWTVENPEAKVSNLEMQSDLASSLAMVELVRTAFWTIGRGLDPSTYKDKVGQMTNFALRVLSIRAQHKMGDKRLTYGKMLRDLNGHILEMAGQAAAKTVIVWPNPLPEDPKETTAELQVEVAMGVVSRQTASEELGRDWKTEQARMRQESKEQATLGQYLMDQFDRGGATNRDNQDQKHDQGGQSDAARGKQ